MFTKLTSSRLASQAVLCAIVFGIIVIPYFLAREKLDAWTASFLTGSATHPASIGMGVALLLATDILLPVPSSMVSTAAGFILGFTKGTIASLVGMTVSCILGFGLGAMFGRPFARHLMDYNGLKRLEVLSHRFGEWAIVICRPIPVLAEASVLFAGISQFPFYRFVLLSTFANLGISVVYAAVGAFSATANSFLLAFAGSVFLPLIPMIAMNKTRKKWDVCCSDREGSH